MFKVNANRVQRTNNVSTLSKCSAASKNYFEDSFISEFAGTAKIRAPLIHLGYYTRAEILNKLINNYIDFLSANKVLQIISCGCGFDTTFWRLSQANLLNDGSIVVEIDFPSVIQEKVLLINQSEKLKSYLNEIIDPEPSSKVHKLSSNYYLLKIDLRNIVLIEELLSEIKIDFDVPTLFLSECAITYMKDQDSDNLIKWMGEKFKNSCFINYEQIHPFDTFGQIMVNHFQKLQSPLFSIFKYPDCKSHITRYKILGFERSFAVSEWDALMWLTSEEERKRAFSLELFDELEEFHLKCVHYVIAFAGNGISSTWIDSFPPFILSKTYQVDVRPKLCCDSVKNSFKLCKHCSCNVKEYNFLFGGCNEQNRSSHIYKCSSFSLGVKSIKRLDSTHMKLDLVYGNVTYFEINKMEFVCLYGGRTSPDKVWNNGLPVIFELMEGDIFVNKPIIIEGNPTPRYRTAMVSLNSNETQAQFWMFGGRTSSLNHSLADFWEFVITCSDEKNLTGKWKQVKRTGDLWPSGRVSHSITPCSETLALFLIGGLNTDSFFVFNDVWKWCCETGTWSEVELVGKLLPRYGHTSHLKDGTIFLIGGVNTLAGMQPGLATISLNNLTVAEYEFPPLSPPPLLFNHTSVIFDENVLQIVGGGGQCFSFGAYFNEQVFYLKIDQLSNDRVPMSTGVLKEF